MLVSRLAILDEISTTLGLDDVVADIVSISASYAWIWATFSTKLLILSFAEEKLTNSLKVLYE